MHIKAIVKFVSFVSFVFFNEALVLPVVSLLAVDTPPPLVPAAESPEISCCLSS
jgi:hypothetical protein